VTPELLARLRTEFHVIAARAGDPVDNADRAYYALAGQLEHGTIVAYEVDGGIRLFPAGGHGE
jgi:hypothetical protein